VNDLLLHGSIAALWTFLGGEVCDRHFSEYRTACIITSGSLVMAAGAIKEEFIDERRQKQDYIGDAIGVGLGIAVKF